MKGYGISKNELKEINRMQVMRTIWECGPISRADIARELCITRAAITVITNEMIEDGLIREIGKNPDTKDVHVNRGRRKVLLEINSDSCFVIGVYIDIRHLSVGLATVNGDILEKENVEIDPAVECKELVEIIRGIIDKLLSHSCLNRNQIIGVGIGIMPEMPYDLYRLLEGSVENASKLCEECSISLEIPVYVGSALSELALLCGSERADAGKNFMNSFIYSDDEKFFLTHVMKVPRCCERFTTSTGINNLCVKPGADRSECGSDGTVKSELTGLAIGRKVMGIYGEKSTPVLYRITGGSGRKISASQIMTAYECGDIALTDVYNDVMNGLSILINNISCISGCKKVYFYKSGFTAAQLEKLERHIGKYCFSKSVPALKLCDVTDENTFLSGCVYAVLKGVFGADEKRSVI